MCGNAIPATLLATGAIAQDSSSSSMMDSSMSSMPMDSKSSASSMMSSEPMTNDAVLAPRIPVDILSGYTRVDNDQLGTKIIGAPVYSSDATDADHLGDINDIVLTKNGEVGAVVIGVGGFLGLGEKQVAVDYSALKWVIAADNTERYVLATTVDELTNAPDFTTVDDKPGDASGMISSSSAM